MKKENLVEYKSLSHRIGNQWHSIHKVLFPKKDAAKDQLEKQKEINNNLQKSLKDTLNTHKQLQKSHDLLLKQTQADKNHSKPVPVVNPEPTKVEPTPIKPEIPKITKTEPDSNKPTPVTDTKKPEPEIKLKDPKVIKPEVPDIHKPDITPAPYIPRTPKTDDSSLSPKAAVVKKTVKSDVKSWKNTE